MRSPGRVRKKEPRRHQQWLRAPGRQEGPAWSQKPPRTRLVHCQPFFPGPAHVGLTLNPGAACAVQDKGRTLVRRPHGEWSPGEVKSPLRET